MHACISDSGRQFQHLIQHFPDSNIILGTICVRNVLRDFSIALYLH
jgi:hypothetical protein